MAENEGARAADVVCFIDEAGDCSYLRNLTAEQDQQIYLLCALPVPSEHLNYIRLQVRSAFDRFAEAAPEGGKHHITDAFQPGNETWAEVARSVREEIFDLMLRLELRVIYTARRFRIARKRRDLHERMKRAVDLPELPTPRMYAVPGANRPSREQVDDRVMTDLLLLLEVFMEQAERQVADIRFDEINATVVRRYARVLERTQNLSYRKHIFVARNLLTGQNETRTLEMRANTDFKLNTTHLGGIAVVGKSDPLVFAADVVVNSLWRHLAALAFNAPLNDGTALKGWVLEPITFYDRSLRPSLMDKF